MVGIYKVDTENFWQYNCFTSRFALCRIAININSTDNLAATIELDRTLD